MDKFVYLLLIVSAASGCVSSRQTLNDADRLPAHNLVGYGRTAITKNGELELISSASHFAFSFEGERCQIKVALPTWQQHNYLQYTLDGVYQKRVRINKDAATPLVITATGNGKHTVEVFKTTEAHTGPIFIQSIEGKRLQSVKPSTAPLIEFIGNSITCGAAADASEVACGQGEYHDQHNAYDAYGPRVARTLGCNFMLSSVSGYGMYRNWNSDGPALPQVYAKTDFQQDGERQWDFSTYSPKIVSIALGTNDLSKGDGVKPRLPFDSTAFVNSYIRFVQQVKTNYPSAQIALLSSAMINGPDRLLLQNCLSAVKTTIDAFYPSGKPVALHFFKPMQARGCTGHPSVEDHAILANELTPFFKSLLN